MAEIITVPLGHVNFPKSIDKEILAGYSLKA